MVLVTRSRLTRPPRPPAPLDTQQKIETPAKSITIMSTQDFEPNKTPPFPMPDPAEFSRNLAQVAAQSQHALTDFMAHQSESMERTGPDPYNLGEAFSDLLSRMASNPQVMMEAYARFWQDQITLWHTSWRRLMGEDVEPVITPARGDRRWRHEDWSEVFIFDYMKQSYLLTSRWLLDTVDSVEGFDPHTKARVEFYTKQMADAVSPANFAMTNPEVIRETMRTNGENLVKGLNNLLSDLKRGKGNLWIRQTDLDHFEVGRNIAVTPGSVVYQNELMQLIQYSPTTKQTYEKPLLIFPPWINKFYILDLREENSFIKWAVSKGYTVFVVSWVNPGAALSDRCFTDYMHEGVLDALDAVEKATGAKSVNAIGYCIGGTLLASALAYMAAKGDKRIASATFFAAQVDFEHAGELQVFIDERQLESLEAQMKANGGFLDGVNLANTFNALRANDLIWSFVINNYLLGKDPTRFDLLYWNSDQTRMPLTMQMYYLREFYLDNKLARGEMVVDGVHLDLSKIKIPVYIQSSREDHIAPYKSVYQATQHFGGPTRFICAGSGHIAGVINHPDAKKYMHWTNDDLPGDVEDWWEGAEEHPGSWWPDWHQWLSKKSGKKIPARKPGDGKLKALEPAPGSYVKVKS